MYLLKQITQIIAEKDSYHIVETMLFIFIQQICEGTLVLSLFFPCSFLICLNGRSRGTFLCFLISLFFLFWFLTFIPCNRELNFNGRSHGNKGN